MYQWRRFQFFEEEPLGSSVAEELKEKITCSSSGRGQIAVGAEDGMVHVIDRSLKLSYSFQAHSVSISHIQQLKQKNVLISLGEDDSATAQEPAMCLKMWDLNKIEPEGTSTSGPACTRALKVFTSKFPAAKITSFLVFEEAPPVLLICIGLETGVIYCIRGDIARERITRQKLLADAGTNEKPASPVTGFGFRVDGLILQLFAVTMSTIYLFDMHQKPPLKHTLDQHGCNGQCVTMSDTQELVVGRHEAVYFYEPDGRGPCWAFEGEKHFVDWFRGYLLTVITDQRNPDNKFFNIYDLKNKLIAYSIPVGDVAHILCEWGIIILITKDQKVICTREKDMGSKLEMLFRKNLYTVAINLVQSQQTDAIATAEVLRKYGDHLYGKQDYDEAMTQYIRTIGQLEPSYVIQKFIDAQRIHNLTHYLEKLHEKGLATADHTTLLLNCYAKLKDVTKLDQFLKGGDGSGAEPHFDVETAIKVCRAAGYHQNALYVAKAAEEHEWYLKILLDDLGHYDDALRYVDGLPAHEAVITMKKYGTILMQYKPAETTDTLVKLCTLVDRSSKNSNSRGNGVPTPLDFMHVYIGQPQWLAPFLELYIGKVKDSPYHVEIHNILLGLYLPQCLQAPSIGNFTMLKENHVDDTASGSKTISIGGSMEHPQKGLVVNVDTAYEETEHEKSERRNKGLGLLKRGWSSQESQPQYDANLAVMLCKTHKFRDGLVFLYEKLKLYKEVLNCYMKDGDYQGLLSCCKRLGDPGRGGDPTLWADVLAYFGERLDDCAKEVKEVLTYVEREKLLPPLIVLQTLSKNPSLTLDVVKEYLSHQLEEESKHIQEDQKAIEKYLEETNKMRAEIQKFKTTATLFQDSKCMVCTSALDLPAVHFLCMHSFHQRCLGDNETECPKCAPKNRTLLEMKRSLEHHANDHDRFFQLVRNSEDGFSVIAEHFGRGMLNRSQKFSDPIR